jgi:hypothetical protein
MRKGTEAKGPISLDPFQQGSILAVSVYKLNFHHDKGNRKTDGGLEGCRLDP